jgi:hypothetical protein
MNVVIVLMTIHIIDGDDSSEYGVAIVKITKRNY